MSNLNPRLSAILSNPKLKDSQKARKIRGFLTHAQRNREKIGFEDLWSAILFIEQGGPGCIPQSVGTQWILKNPRTFRNMVRNIDWFVIATREEAKTRPMLGIWFFPLFLCSKELLSMMDWPAFMWIWKYLAGEYGFGNAHWYEAWCVGRGEETYTSSESWIIGPLGNAVLHGWRTCNNDRLVRGLLNHSRDLLAQLLADAGIGPTMLMYVRLIEWHWDLFEPHVDWFQSRLPEVDIRDLCTTVESWSS